jgi:Mrp family chromosome partitioning ATPase
MRELLREAEAEYDLVVIDTPPVGLVADIIPFLTETGGVIIVGRVGKTASRTATSVREQLAFVNARVLGVVANCSTANYSYYGYAYNNGKVVR